MFTTKIVGLAVAGLLFTGAAQAFPGAADDAGVRLQSQMTYADAHNGMPQSAATAFPGRADDAGVRLQSQMTFADQHRARTTETLRAGVQPARPASTWTD